MHRLFHASSRRVAALGLLIAALAPTILPLTSRADEPAAGPAAASPVAAARRTDLPAFGVNAPFHTGSSVLLDYSRARAFGAQTVLINILWSDVEPVRTDPPTYTWGSVDDLVTAATSNGLEPFIVILGGSPRSGYSGDSKILTAAGRAALAQLATSGATRYRGKVRFWSFFNEPDCNGRTAPPWNDVPNSCYGNYGAEYAKLMRAIYPAVKAADPQALVALGGIAYELFSTGEAFAREFVDEFLAAGGADSIDLFNFHYYVEFDETWARFGPGPAGKTAYLRSVLASHGVSKPIILTEIGKAGVFEGDDVQADYLVKSLARGFAGGNDMILWYELSDPPLDPGYKFGLINSDGSFKPAATAFQILSQKLAGLTSHGCPDTSFDGVEAYGFRSPSQRQWELVAWSRDSLTRTVQLSADQVVRTTRTRQVTTLRDGTDGRADGLIAIPIGPSPVVLDVTPVTTTVPAGSRPFKLFLPGVLRQAGSC